MRSQDSVIIKAELSELDDRECRDLLVNMIAGYRELARLIQDQGKSNLDNCPCRVCEMKRELDRYDLL